ncbi:MAG: phosphoethanolamine--lipid A transferase [Comamonas sp.]
MTFFARFITPSGKAAAQRDAAIAPADTAAFPPHSDGLPFSADLATTASKAARPVWQWSLFISLWLASVGNLALWKTIAQTEGFSTTQQWTLGLSLGLAIACACWALLTLISWGRAAKPVLVAMCWIAAFAACFMLNYGIAIDASMLVNVLQTDAKEAADLLHWSLVVTVGAIAIPPTWWLYRQTLPQHKGWRPVLRQLAMVLIAVLALVLVVMAGFRPISSAMRNHTSLRYMMNPLSTVYAAGNLVAQQIHHRDTTLYPIGEDAKLGASYAAQASFPIYALVVGETGRAGNFATNGYERATTPLLSARQDLAVATNAWSCGTSTAVSLPCMFSHLGRSSQDSSKSYENLLDVLQRAGLAVLWVENQSGCKGVCTRVNNANTKNDLPAAARQALCQDGECVDMALLEGLDERINALPAEQRAKGVVLVLHQMGSHGPAYFKRSLSQDKAFSPECNSVNLQSCDRASLVNAYDNSVVATDRMLGGLIDWLARKGQRQPTAMMYVADHGESLGENNIYLHGLPYSVAPDVQKHVPWITWLSPAMQQRMGLSTSCLQQAVGTARISHDNLFHSMLGLTDVQTALHQPELDIFASCKGRAAPPVALAPATPMAHVAAASIAAPAPSPLAAPASNGRKRG